jgi:hypothetical protein
VGNRLFRVHEYAVVIRRAMHGGSQMGKIGTHGMRICEKHNNTSMCGYVLDSCACVRNYGVNGRARVCVS